MIAPRFAAVPCRAAALAVALAVTPAAVVLGTGPVAAQGSPSASSSGALAEALAVELGRPLTPPEGWALQQTVVDHLGKVRQVRAAFVERLAVATGLAAETVEAELPPLGRGSLSAPRDLRPGIAAGLGRPLAAAEEQAVAAAEADRTAALQPHRQALADRLAVLTGLAPARILPLLPGLGL